MEHLDLLGDGAFLPETSTSNVGYTTYLVGGAVRDKLMGLTPTDLDYVVVGATPDQLIAKGYTQVGASFPVFLHPSTGSEYALARRERSTGPGYSDFSVDFDKSVTLLEDLERRDLTLNAIAEDSNGNLIDPFNGQSDIAKRKLRHVSPAFAEDPIRVLRIARLKARFGHTWSIAAETRLLIDQMKADGLLYALQPDRVYAETAKAMEDNNPHIYFQTLDELNVLDVIFPSIHDLKSYREGSRWHLEANVFEHTMSMLAMAPTVRLKWMALYHDIAKPACRRLYGNGAGHDSAELAEPLIDIQLPSKLKSDIIFAIENHIRIFRALDYELSPRKIAKLFKAFRKRRDLFEELIELGHIDKRGAISYYVRPRADFTWLLEAFDKCNAYSPMLWILSKEDRPSNNAIFQHVHQTYINIIKETHEMQNQTRGI